MPALLSPADLADRFGGDTTDRQVKDWTRAYRWPHVRVGRKVFFTEAQVDAIVAKHTVITKEKAEVVVDGQTAKSAARSRK